MALRFQHDGYSDEGVAYYIKIYDEEWASAAIIVEATSIGPDAYVIEWNPIEEERIAPILTSKCTISLYMDTAALQTFIDEISTSVYEGQLRVVIGRDGNDYWFGHILPDLMVIQDLNIENKPGVKLIATDGIKRLQKTFYSTDATTPYSGKETIIGHLYNIINAIGLVDLIDLQAGTPVVLRTIMNWFATGQDTGDPCSNIRFAHRALYQIDEKSNYVFQSHYEVLKIVCRTFNCRFLMTGGAYRFEQFNEYAGSSYTQYSYDSSEALIAGVSFPINLVVGDTFTEKYGGGNFTYFPPLNEVEVNYTHIEKTNHAIGTTWDESTSPTVTIEDTKTGAVFLFSAMFDFSVTLSAPIGPATNYPHWLKFRFTIQVGSFYLNRTASINNNSLSYTTTVWIGSLNYYEQMIPVGRAAYTGELVTTRIDIPPTPISVTDGDLTLTFAYVEAWEFDGTVVPGGELTVTFTMYNARLENVTSGEVSQQTDTKTTSAFNLTSGNSEKLVINTVLGDGPTGAAFGHLEYFDSAAWQIGDENNGWGVGAGGTVSIAELLGDEIIKTQGLPIRIGQNRVTHTTLETFYKIVRDTEGWIFWRGRLNGGKDVWDGAWYLSDATGQTSGNTVTDRNYIGKITLGLSGGDQILLPDKNTIFNSGSPDDIAIIDTIAINTLPGITSVISQVYPQTNHPIEDGSTVTEIPIETQTEDGVWQTGDVITLVNPDTGESQDFTVTTDTSVGDDVIQVSSTTADADFPPGTWIIIASTNSGGGDGSTRFFREEFTSPGAALTVTENGGVLPASSAGIRVYWDNGQIISKNYWSVSGSIITLTFTPSDMASISIWVEFAV